MAEALLSFGVERLWNLLVQETERFQGVEDQFDGLKTDVEMLRRFLEDVDAKKHTSAMVRKTIKDIKEIVLDAEDIIETFLLKKELRESSSSWNSVRRFAYVTVRRVGLAFDMRTIRKRISKVIHDMQSFGVKEVIVNKKYTQSLQKKQSQMRQTFSSVNEEDPLVGMEQNVEIVVGYLVEEDISQMVSITGMGGIGKTTLARKVFNHETIKSHFPRLAWVCVSQQFSRNDVWQTILQQLMPEIKVLEMTEQVLQEKLVQVLETQKVLIVIDDIWREEDWDLIKHVFLPKKGWKVLLTSRNEEVALHADKKCVNFKPKCLTFEESWDLLQMIAFPIKDTSELKTDEDVKEIGKEMIKHCGGLPLALKVLGGLLGKKHNLHEWKMIHENIKAHIVGGTSCNDTSISSVYHVLYLSFEELPAYLKQCFLYLAHLPEDYSISVEDLSYYWAAERITRPVYSDGASIRDVADGYIEELMKRNMIISERDVDTLRFETCQLHDMMREVCQNKAKEENFVQTIGTSTANSKSPCKSRRLAVHKFRETFNVVTEVTNESLRTLLFIESEGWKATSLFFTRLQLMRVLDLSMAKFEGGEVPSSIGKLIHLRYLSLRGADVNHLPSSMRNLKQLLYLNLDVGYHNEVYIPNFLKEMRELTYLWLPERLHGHVNMELGNLVKLETLKNFSTDHGSVSDLQAMTKLRILSMYIEGKGCSMKTLSSSLSKITHLENLTIYYNDELFAPTNDDDEELIASTNDDDEEGFVWDFVHLRQLRLSIYAPRLPDARSFPSHLTNIHLNHCCLKEDPMPILEKLSQLKKVRLWSASFSGRRMVCSRDGFPKLQKLEFDGLKEWEEWIVEEGSMPLLHTLDIKDCKMWEKWIVEKGSMPLLRNLDIEKCKKLEEWIVEEGAMRDLYQLNIRDCAKLKELPDGLRFITSLEDLQVEIGAWGDFRLSEGYLPSHLTTISLYGCHMEEDPLPILEKLLHLKEVKLLRESFNGKRMVCSRGGFPQLQKLQFDRLKEWEEWIVEEGSMPLLHSLDIDFCPKLKELPEGLWKRSLQSPTHPLC